MDVRINDSMTAIGRMTDRLAILSQQMVVMADETDNDGYIRVEDGTLRPSAGQKLELIHREAGEFMKYEAEDEQSEVVVGEKGEGYDYNMERQALDDEYKVTMNDLLPLIFWQVNNGISSQAFYHDLSLSCFSLDELNVDNILKREARLSIEHQVKEGDETKLKPSPQKHNDQDHEDVDYFAADLMNYISRVQKNFRDVESGINKPKQKMNLPFETFPWINIDKGRRYTEILPFSKHERLAGWMANPEYQRMLHDNQLVDTRLYFKRHGRFEETHRVYQPPAFRRPVQSVIKDQAGGIEFADGMYSKIKSDLTAARDCCADVRLHDSRSVLEALNRFDKLFLETITNMEYQNKIVKQDNAEIDGRNDALLAFVKKNNVELARLEKARRQTRENLVQKKADRDKYMMQDTEDIRKNELQLALHRERLNLEEVKETEDLLRDDYVKACNSRNEKNREIKNLVTFLKDSKGRSRGVIGSLEGSLEHMNQRSHWMRLF